MLSVETRNKIGLIVFIALFVGGALFTVFAVFYNRGTLVVNADPPFYVNVENVKGTDCTESPCKLVLAPGEYNVTFSKTGYNDERKRVNIGLFGTTSQELKFSYIPSLNEIGKESDLNLFGEPPAAFKYTLAFDNEASKQALYQENADGSDRKIISYFTRFIKDYQVFQDARTSQESGRQISLVDKSETSSTLYLIDLVQKTRTAIGAYPSVSGVKWLQNGDIIFSARDSGDYTDSLFYYQPVSQKLRKMDLKASLDNIVSYQPDLIIAATSQNVSGLSTGQNLQGQLVVLSSAAATPEVQAQPATDTGSGTISFVEYSLQSFQARLIAGTSDLSLPQKLKLDEAGKNILALSGGMVYKLVISP